MTQPVHRLADFWNGVVSMGAVGEAQRAPFDMLMGSMGGETSPLGQMMSSMTNMWSTAMTQSMSPYQNNPLDINPLKEFLEKHIDFDAIAALNKSQTVCCRNGCFDGQSGSLQWQTLDRESRSWHQPACPRFLKRLKLKANIIGMVVIQATQPFTP